MAEMIFVLNLKGKRFEVKDDCWYHLDEEKYVDTPHESQCKYNDYRVCGAAKSVDNFLWRNVKHNYSDKIPAMDISKWISDLTSATVIKVVDGDTYDVAVFVPFSSIPNIIGTVGNGGFVTKLRIRLAHIDVAEHNTAQGVFAIQLVNQIISEAKNEVKLKFWKKEMYGRDMAEIFVKYGEVEINLANYLIQYRHETYGKIAHPYEGGTKLPFDVFSTASS